MNNTTQDDTIKYIGQWMITYSFLFIVCFITLITFLNLCSSFFLYGLENHQHFSIFRCCNWLNRFTHRYMHNVGKFCRCGGGCIPLDTGGGGGAGGEGFLIILLFLLIFFVFFITFGVFFITLFEESWDDSEYTRSLHQHVRNRYPTNITSTNSKRIIFKEPIPDLMKKYDQWNCPICLENMNGTICLFACGHRVHKECFGKMLENGHASKCPLCNMEYQSTYVHMDEKTKEWKDMYEYQSFT